MTTKTTEPRSPGRPRSDDPRQVRGVRLTAEEWAKFQALGGALWLRARLDRARLTPEQAAQRAALLDEAAGQARLPIGAP